MDAAAASLKRIEDAMRRAASPLSRALKALAEANRDRGTCLCLDHEDFCEVLIADRHWRRGRDETLRDRARLALVDLVQEQGFRRVAVLVEPAEGAGRLDESALALTLAALEVTSALTAIGAEADEGLAEIAPRDGARAVAVPMPPAPRSETMTNDGVWGI